MRCPYCGYESCHVITQTEWNIKGYGFGKGCLGALCLGPTGWLCGLCGMGKGKSTSLTYWLCDHCGHKFKA